MLHAAKSYMSITFLQFEWYGDIFPSMNKVWRRDILKYIILFISCSGIRRRLVAKADSAADLNHLVTSAFP